jgi:copper homeostasis protein
MTQPGNRKLLEVIVENVEDAIEAMEGGADRLEVVRDLHLGGLTPDFAELAAIVASVDTPLRVMVRENPTLALSGATELVKLCETASNISRMGVEGLVLGFASNGELDLESLRLIAEAAPNMRLTFHRAFDASANPERSIDHLKSMKRVDRILTDGGAGSWSTRKERLRKWQRLAAPEITIVAAAGVRPDVFRDLMQDNSIREIHVGRAARVEPDTRSRVSRIKVAQLKGELT